MTVPATASHTIVARCHWPDAEDTAALVGQASTRVGVESITVPPTATIQGPVEAPTRIYHAPVVPLVCCAAMIPTLCTLAGNVPEFWNQAHTVSLFVAVTGCVAAAGNET